MAAACEEITDATGINLMALMVRKDISGEMSDKVYGLGEKFMSRGIAGQPTGRNY